MTSVSRERCALKFTEGICKNVGSNHVMPRSLLSWGEAIT
jgi:hypothetical protein